jgi:hypothetical protein
MCQLIIEYSLTGRWRSKNTNTFCSDYKIISVPRHLFGKSYIIGVTIDNRKQWRARLDAITSNAVYDIKRIS